MKEQIKLVNYNTKQKFMENICKISKQCASQRHETEYLKVFIRTFRIIYSVMQ